MKLETAHSCGGIPSLLTDVAGHFRVQSVCTFIPSDLIVYKKKIITGGLQRQIKHCLLC